VALRLGLWERTARTEILEQSTSAPRILSADVADAIEALVGPPERRFLPIAFEKNAIVQKLVGIIPTRTVLFMSRPRMGRRSACGYLISRAARRWPVLGAAGR
jgi:hypothetical protein